MKLAIISPTEHLPVVENYVLAYHFALGQHLVNDSDYWTWYRRAQSRGQFIIVDNGAAEPEEERVDFDYIMECALSMDADEIVLPDKLMDKEATLEMSLEVPMLRHIPKRKRMVVPQGSTWSEWKECLHTLMSYCQPASIGVPKWLENWEGGRAKAIEIIVNHEYHKWAHIHLLGIHSRPFQEVTDVLKVYRGIRGIDTAAPVAYAQHGEQIKDDVHYSVLWKNTTAYYNILTSNIRTYAKFVHDEPWKLDLEEANAR